MHIGLIGCGLWGRNILRDLLALGARVSVVDVDPGACLQAQAMGAHAAAADRPASVDGWVIATPASKHAAEILQLTDGRPILCEKPLCADVNQAQAIAVGVRAPVHLMDVWRYHPAVEMLAELAAQQTLGAAQGLRMTRANWTSPRTDVDSAWNLAPHEVSIYLEIFGDYPQPQAAQAEWLDGGIRSLWSHWRGASGRWLVSELSNRIEQRRREIRLHCAQGVWVYDGVSAQICGYSGPADERLQASASQTLPLSSDSALRRQLVAWLSYLSGGAPPKSDLRYGVSVVETIVALRTLAGAPAH